MKSVGSLDPVLEGAIEEPYPSTDICVKHK